MSTMRAAILLSMLATTAFSAGSYKLVWSDEFDYTGLPDPAKWYYDVGGWGWGNNELEFYKAANPKNTWVDSGALKITVRREDTTYADWQGNPKTNHVSSARLNTYDRQLWKYGRFEARMKLPKGAGQWPAFWVVPPAGSPYGQWPASGEIDVMENYGVDPSVMHGSVHTKNNYGATSLNNYAVVSHPSDSFHVYALDWKPDTIAISVDGNEYFRYVNPKTTYADWPFDQQCFLILNVAVNGIWGTSQVDTTVLPQSLFVDYVRVYQRADAPEDSFALALTQTPGGTISVSPAKASYKSGEKIQIKAVPDEGFTFSGWATGTASTLAKDSVLVQTLSALSARFATAGEMIANGGFDHDWTGWSFWNHASLTPTRTLRNGQGCLRAGGVGAYEWYAQTTYAGFAVQAGRQYQASFVASASAKRTFEIFLSQANSPGDSVTIPSIVNVGIDPSRHELTWTAFSTTDSARLEIDFAGDTAELCLDSISLVQRTTTAAALPARKNGLRASMQDGSFVISSDAAGSWLLSRPDGQVVAHGRIAANGVQRQAIETTGLLILRFEASDGSIGASSLTNLSGRPR